MRCPNCKNKVLQKSGSKTKLRVDGPVEFTEDGCFAKCHWCKSQVKIPIQIQSGTPIPTERFVIQKNS